MSNNYEILSEEPISGSEILDVLKKKGKEQELTYREGRIEEHLKKFNKLTKKKFADALKELKALEVARLEDSHYFKILDIMPKTGTELRAITAHSGVVIVDENVTAILDVLNKYRA